MIIELEKQIRDVQRELARGARTGHVSPEAVQGGPIALGKDGPHALQAVFGECLKKWRPPKIEHSPEILRRYATQDTSAMKGAYLER